MSTRPFLEKYSGESVDALLSLEHSYSLDSLVLAVEQAINQMTTRKGVGSLTNEELTILVVEALEREVNNGGYNQYFVNSPEHVSVVVDSLHRIGCPKVAKITKDAIASLHLPRLSVSDIQSVIYDDDPKREEALGECDRQFFEYPEPIADRLFAFIKANRNMIHLM